MSTVTRDTDVKNAETATEKPTPETAPPPAKSIEDRLFTPASPEKEDKPVTPAAPAEATEPPERHAESDQEDDGQKTGMPRRTAKRFEELLDKNRKLEIELREHKAAKPADNSGEPKEPDPEHDQFKTWDEFWAAERQYRKDHAEWAVKQDRAEREAERAQAIQAEKSAAITKAWNTKAAKTMERHPEFRMLVQESDAHPIKAELLEGMADATSEFIATSLVGPDILLHYADHPKELAQLNSMAADARNRELLRIADHILEEISPAKKLTKAPPPSTSLKGGNAGISPDKAIEDRFYK